jgi:flap endonuclease-1
MGIKKLLKFLNNYDNIVNCKNISDYKGTKIAIDISLLIYQIIIGVRNTGTDIINNKGNRVTHILGLFNKIIFLLKNSIIPVFIFDGKPSKLKNQTLYQRRKTKQTYITKLNETTNEKEKIKYLKKTVSIGKKELDECRELLELMGIPYINAPEEADSQCAYLAKNGFVDAVYSDDMDILTFGSPIIIKNLISLKNKPIELNLNNILEKLNLSYDEFIDFCILLGCDYSNGISNINYNIIYEYYMRNKNIEDTLKSLKANNFNVPVQLDYQEIKKYYKEGPYIEITNLEMKPINNELLINILVNKYGLLKFKIINKLNQLSVLETHKFNI